MVSKIRYIRKDPEEEDEDEDEHKKKSLHIKDLKVRRKAESEEREEPEEEEEEKEKEDEGEDDEGDDIAEAEDENKSLDRVYRKIDELQEAVKELALSLTSVADTQRGLNEALTKSLDDVTDEIAKRLDIVEKQIGVKASAEAERSAHAMVSGLKTPAGDEGAGKSPSSEEAIKPSPKELKENDESIYQKGRTEIIKSVVTPAPPSGAILQNPGTPRKSPVDSFIAQVLSNEVPREARMSALKNAQKEQFGRLM